MTNEDEPRKVCCQRCGDPLPLRPAISRRDNKTPVCSRCGWEEALIDSGIEGLGLLISGIMRREARFSMRLASAAARGLVDEHANPSIEDDPGFWDYTGSEADRNTVAAMKQFGGSFVQALGEAAERADRTNLAKIKATWPDIWAQYSEHHWLRKE